MTIDQRVRLDRLLAEFDLGAKDRAEIVAFAAAKAPISIGQARAIIPSPRILKIG